MEQIETRRTVILVDGGYYRIRAKDLWGSKNPRDRANELYDYCKLHITEPTEPRDLYRVFYYDCPGLKTTIEHPLTHARINFASGSGTTWTEDFFKCLCKKSKVALRKGELLESQAQYALKTDVMKDLLSGARTISSLTEADFYLDVKQKGVDMRIGLDVASFCANHCINQIVLIAGDSDFLPVAKMARRNGIEFILDPLKQYVKANLIEHIDGIECFTDHMP